MKIKTKKQFRLDELIKYIFDNGIEDRSFPSNGGSAFDMCEARISGSGNIKTTGYINEHTTFTVEVEEELTEETELCDVTTFIKKPQGILPVYTTSASIRECLDSLTGDDIEPLKIFNGVTEIWTKEHGIPRGRRKKVYK